MQPTRVLPQAALLWAFSLDLVCASVYDIPDSLYLEPVDAEFTLGCDSIDGQKVLPRPNATSFEWWYFDVVSTSSANESIVVVFYESSPTSFIAPYPPLLYVTISGTFADGTHWNVPIKAPSTGPNSALIKANSTSVSGNWQNTGFQFRGTDGLTKYVVEGTSPTNNISGSIVFNSVAPPHLPCGPIKPGQTEVILPNIGWSNAVPAAIATVDFTVNGERTAFTGVGYHDKNWGDVPLMAAVKSWYWGHAQLGPYSLVWFDALSKNTTEYVSGYVSLDGKILGASCDSGAVKVRPYGENSQYPPDPTSGDPTGFTIEYDLGEDGILVANVTKTLNLADVTVYERDIGPIVGGLVGGDQYTGKALWEQFKFS